MDCLYLSYNFLYTAPLWRWMCCRFASMLRVESKGPIGAVESRQQRPRPAPPSDRNQIEYVSGKVCIYLALTHPGRCLCVRDRLRLACSEWASLSPAPADRWWDRWAI